MLPFNDRVVVGEAGGAMNTNRFVLLPQSQARRVQQSGR